MFRWLTILCLVVSGCAEIRLGPLPSVRSAAVEILVDGRLELSGWFADPEGYIVTAAHGIGAHTNGMTVLLADGQILPAERVALDTSHDLALLRVPSLRPPVPFLPVAPEEAAQGDRVWFYGAGEFRHGLLIEGNMTRAEPTYNFYAKHEWVTKCHLVAAPSPPGTSGGPWINSDGQVVANQSGYMNSGAGSSGIALVAPAQAIRRLIQTRRAAPYPTLGCNVEELWTQNVGFIQRLPKGLLGLVTVTVQTNGPAMRAGLNKESVITRAGGQPLRYTYDLLPVLDAHKPGDTIPLEVWNPGDKTSRVVRVQLEATKV